MSQLTFIEIGRDKYKQAFAVRYKPTRNVQVTGVWFRLARADYRDAHRIWYGTEGNDVPELVVRVTGQTQNAALQNVPDENTVYATTTITWDKYPSLWPNLEFKLVLASFSNPVRLQANTDYWFVVDLGTNLPKYACQVAADPDRTATDYTEWATKGSSGAWWNNSATWRNYAWIFGLYYRVDEEDEARGARYHVVIDGKGYMSPDNLHSAITSTAVPFTAKFGSGQKEWSDLQFPYSADSWDNWLGGIGTERASDRENGYTIGSGVDTRTRGQITIMPAVWETSKAGTRPPRNQDIYHETITFPIRDTDTWYFKHATPVQMPATSVTVAKLRTALARYFAGPWHTLHIRIETDNMGVPSGTPVTADNLQPIDIVVPESAVNNMMTWYTIDLSSEIGANWTTTGGEKVWIIVEAQGWPTSESAGGAQAEPFLQLRFTNDSLDPNEYSSSFYPTGYKPKVWDGTSWVDASFNGKTWAIQWNILDDGLGAQVEDFVYWPSQNKLYCVADKLYVWNEGPNKWDGYWSEVTGAGTGCRRVVVFGDTLYVSKGYTTQMLKSTDGVTFTGVTDDQSQPVNGLEMFVAEGYLWVATGKNTVRKTNGTSWSSDIIVGTSDYDITGFALFQGQIHVAKEDGIWYIDQNDLSHQRIDYSDQVYQHNGRGIANFGELLYFNVRNSYWRWTGATIDFKGPYDTYGSVPETWTGTVVDAVQVSKHLYCALWASTTGTSQVLAFNGIGWHPVYAPFGTVGNKVRAVYWTAGNQAGATITDGGRLWIGEDSHVRFIELPDRTDTPNEWAGKTFDQYGWIELPWQDFGLREVDKFFRDVRLEVEQFTSNYKDNLTIRLGCYVDDDSPNATFHWLGEFRGGQEVRAAFPPDLKGKAVKLIVGLEVRGAQVTPVIRSITINALLRPPQNYVHTVQVLLGDNLLDMHGERIPRTAAEMWNELREAAEKKTPVRVQFPWGGFEAFITSLSARTIAYREEGARPDGAWEKVAVVSFVEAR